MVESVINMLLMAIVFIVVIGILFLIFGSTTCDSLANQTAMDLKWAIDEVAKDESEGGIPFYMGDGVPESAVYYRQAPIRLCQQYGEYSYIKSFMGGEPEYKIYYEKFPEGFFQGGSWMWAENYPWSGGAASSFFFWAGMRGLTLGIKAIKTVTVAHGLWKGANLLKSVGKIQEDIRAKDFLTALTDPAKFAERVGLTDFLTSDCELNKLVEGLSKQEAKTILDGLKNAGLLQKNKLTGDLLTVAGKVVVNQEDIPVTIVQSVDQGGGKFALVRKAIAFAKDDTKPGGFDFTDFKIIDDWEAPPVSWADGGKTYVTQMVKPSEAMQNLIQDLKVAGDVDNAQFLLDTYAFSEVGANPLFDFTKPSLTQRIYAATVGKWKRFTESLKLKLYNIKTTVIGPDRAKPIFKAVVDRFTDPAIGADVKEHIMKTLDEANIGVWQRIKDKVKIALGLKTWQEVTVQHLRQYSDELAKRGWVMVLHETDEMNIWEMAMREIWKNPGASGNAIKTTLETTVPNFNYFRNIPYMSITAFDGIEQLASDLKVIQLTATSEEDFMIKGWGFFIENLVDKLKNPANDVEYKYALQELQAFVGVLSADIDAMPITSLKGKFVKYGVNQLNKIVSIEGKAFATPTSWITRGWLFGEWRESCGEAGNNICVYSHGAKMESPIFLSEDVSKNFAGHVNVWRPVEVWKQYLGWQAAMQHIPPHPSFYVVSPCFAMARVWKTRYDGYDTIFIYPEKLNLNDTASNYCYADTNLINAYTTIWFVSDVLTVIETVVSLGTTSAAGQTAKLTFGSVWKATDPVSLGQVLAEAAISWPGWPYKSLDFQIMQEQANETVKEILIKK